MYVYVCMYDIIILYVRMYAVMLQECNNDTVLNLTVILFTFILHVPEVSLDGR